MSKRTFNPKAFFKKITPERLQRLLQRLDLHDVVAAQIDEARPPADRVYHAWVTIEATDRAHADAELKRISDLSRFAGRWYLERGFERAWKSSDPARIEASRVFNEHDLAVELHLDAPAEFEWAYDCFDIDSLTNFKLYRGREPFQIEPSEERKERMRAALSSIFVSMSQGGRVKVEDRLLEDRFLLCAIHEDTMKAQDAFDADGEVVASWGRPVLRAAMIYYPDTAMLLVKAARKRVRAELVRLFGDVFFDDKAFFPDVEEVPDQFDFSALLQPDLELVVDRRDGFAGARVVSFTVARPKPGIPRLVVDCDGRTPCEALRALDCDPELALCTGARVRVEPDGIKYKRSRTIDMANPDHCNLDDTPRDQKLRDYLGQWRLLNEWSSDEPVAVVDDAVEIRRTEPSQHDAVSLIGSRYLDDAVASVGH